MKTRAEIEFHNEVVRGAKALKSDGYNPVRFMHMVYDIGAPDAARQLIGASGTSDGFTTLYEMQLLHMSIEAMALLPWYASLFTPPQITSARARLAAHQFNVPLFLASAQAAPPSWWP